MKNNLKIVYACMLAVFFILVAVVFFKIKHFQAFQQKVLLAHETRKALELLMPDLVQVHVGTIQDVPADGEWRHQITIGLAPPQGVLEYIIKDGHLCRIINGKVLLVADHMGDLRIRRQAQTPDLLEIQIQAQQGVSLVSNLRIRIRS